MNHVATRLLTLIHLLQARPSRKAAELARELGVSERTIHRYMAMLDEIGIPIYSERGPYGGFSLVRGYRLPPLIFTPDEATALYMGVHLVREVWGHTYGEPATAATAKLDNVLPDDVRQEVARAQQSLVVSGIHAANDRPWQATVHLLRRCIIHRLCVRLRYRAPRSEATERLVEPYALAFQWGIWYLAAHCRLRDALRTFRIDRVISAECADEPARPVPRDFDMRAHMAQLYHTETPHQVSVWVAPEAAGAVRDYHGHWMRIELHHDGAATAHFDAASLAWATEWVLSLGQHARVLSPPELIHNVRHELAQALARYPNP